MVLLKVDRQYAGAFPYEGYTPLSADPNRPPLRFGTFKGVQMSTMDIDVAQGIGGIQHVEHLPAATLEVRANTTRPSALEQFLQSLVPETLYHR